MTNVIKASLMAYECPSETTRESEIKKRSKATITQKSK